MEKLQAAIEKARAEREKRQPQQRRAPVQNSAALPASGPWDDIPMVEWNARHLVKNRVVTSDSGAESTSFDMLRTKVLQQMNEHGWRKIAVTSPDKAAGKSTVCCNLIASLSRQKDRRSILFDFDMRRPSIATILGGKPAHGVPELLDEKVSFSEQAIRFKENIAVSMNTSATQSASEFLLRDRTSEIIANIEAVYQPDVMLFDLPPMLLTDDTLAFLKNVDAAILVAGAEATTIDHIDVCEKEIASQTNMMGVVLNKCHFAESKHGYDYY